MLVRYGGPQHPGPVFASVLSAGAFGNLLELTPAATQAVYSDAVASPGGATVSWGTTGPTAGERFSLQIDASGVPGATQQNTSGTSALAVDGGGDQLFGCAAPGFPTPPCLTGPFVRPAGGGADQPVPVSISSSSFASWFAVAAPLGRAAVFAWNPSPPAESPIAVSVWRP